MQATATQDVGIGKHNKSRAEVLASLPLEERNQLLTEYSEAELNLLHCDWDFWARPKQKLPLGKWMTWLILAGRGFGKTRTGAEAIIHWQNPSKVTTTPMTVKGYSHFAIIGQATSDVRDVMLEGESGIISSAPFYNKPRYVASRRVLEWPNGAQAHLYSGDEPDQLRGPQHQKGWVDELVKFKYMEETWDMFELGLRLGNSPQAIVTTTPKPKKLLKKLVADEDVVTTYGSSYENMGNLSPNFIKRVIKKYEGTRLGKQELWGKILTDVEGALWSMTMIENCRINVAPSLERIVVSIDPAVTNKDTSDQTGIIVMGRDKFKRAYILEDASGKYDSKDWAELAIRLYKKWRADYILGEVNNGGDLIKTVIGLLDRTVPFQEVWASRDKYTRATPVSGAYQQERVYHVGHFPELEEELTEWEPGENSPNRLDAAVWGVTDLILEEEEVVGKLIPIPRPF